MQRCRKRGRGTKFQFLQTFLNPRNPLSKTETPSQRLGSPLRPSRMREGGPVRENSPPRYGAGFLLAERFLFPVLFVISISRIPPLSSHRNPWNRHPPPQSQIRRVSVCLSSTFRRHGRRAGRAKVPRLAEAVSRGEGCRNCRNLRTVAY